jgi:hypothetical protein
MPTINDIKPLIFIIVECIAEIVNPVNLLHHSQIFRDHFMIAKAVYSNYCLFYGYLTDSRLPI